MAKSSIICTGLLPFINPTWDLDFLEGEETRDDVAIVKAATEPTAADIAALKKSEERRARRREHRKKRVVCRRSRM